MYILRVQWEREKKKIKKIKEESGQKFSLCQLWPLFPYDPISLFPLYLRKKETWSYCFQITFHKKKLHMFSRFASFFSDSVIIQLVPTHLNICTILYQLQLKIIHVSHSNQSFYYIYFYVVAYGQMLTLARDHNNPTLISRINSISVSRLCD